MRRAAPLLLLLLSLPLEASAQRPTFWSETIEPGGERVEPLRQNLRALLSSRTDSSMLSLGLSIADRALRLQPDDPELQLLRGRLLYDLGRFEASAEQLEALIAADPPGTWAAEAAMVLGVALTRLDRFADAGQAYRRFLEEAIFPSRRAVALTNLAETHIALEQLDTAQALLREAIVTDPDYTLAYFGLAVVLDRLGEQSHALDTMLHGLSVGRGFEDLVHESVFYVPAWEIHYYLALAYEARGEESEARERWQRFLTGGGHAGPYADMARAHIERIDGR